MVGWGGGKGRGGEERVCFNVSVCLVSMSLSVSSLSVCFNVSVCLFQCLCLSLQCLCLSLCLSVCFNVSVCLFQCLCLSLCLSVCFNVSVCLFQCLCRSLCMSVCFNICVCLSLCLSVCFNVRVCPQARTHQLLLHNKDLLDHVTQLVARLHDPGSQGDGGQGHEWPCVPLPFTG